MTTTVHEALAADCAELLGLDAFPRDADFFAAGGHSLTAIRLVARIRARYGVEVPVAEVFTSPTVNELAPVVIGLLGGDLAPAEAHGA
ncbi:phosphopantetheine-binding protein [Nonomuraea sp. NPDC005650]|uniref:phosphopantetheine-binding protein n=1 Tax=Nonomuraea sp. NPDC005650 TaxID=3157045 RepID=UPI0033ADFAF3